MATYAELLPRLRSRLLLDWDHPSLQGPLFVNQEGIARKKLVELAGPKSEDGVTWSVFRTLAQLPATAWLPPLLGAQPDAVRCDPLEMEFWVDVPPARARLLWLLDHLDELTPATPAAAARRERVRRSPEHWREQVVAGAVERGDGVLEGGLEADLLVRTPDALLVVEGKHAGDVAVDTVWDSQRDQIGRCLDAALDLAGQGQQPYYLLASDDYIHQGPYIQAPHYEQLLPGYRDNPTFRAARLPHRSAAELARLEGRIRWLSWADLVDAVLDNSAGLPAQQKRLLIRLVEYLKEKRLLHKGG